MNRPAFQFYPGDWQRDAALRSCSIGARGLWVEMICIMHQAEPYGHLVVNSKPIATETLARMVGCTPTECRRFVLELEGSGVFSREGEVIVSRRMVRDERIRLARAEGGKAGKEHGIKGAEHGVKGGRPAIERGVINPPLEPPPSSSSSVSSSTSSSKPKTLKPSAVVAALPTAGSLCWVSYCESYTRRYGVEPVRNAKVNANLSSLAQRLGTEAAEVAAFFVQHNGQRYVAAGHAVGMLLQDAEKLRTEWATGRRITVSEARNAEAVDAMVEQGKRVDAILGGT